MTQGLFLGSWAKFIAGARLAPYVATDAKTVRAIASFLSPVQGSRVYDIGSGDGRVCIEVAKRFKCACVGLEVDEGLVRDSVENAKRAGVSDLVTFKAADALKEPIGEATHVVLYLSETGNNKMKPQLATLGSGACVVTYTFPMPGWTHDERRVLPHSGVYLYKYILD